LQHSAIRNVGRLYGIAWRAGDGFGCVIRQIDLVGFSIPGLNTLFATFLRQTVKLFNAPAGAA